MNAEGIYRALGGRGEIPAPAGRHKGPLTIIAGGRCVWEDLERPEVRGRGGDWMAVNEIGQHYHGVIHHWVTLHPEFMLGWRTFREAHCYGEGRRAETHSNRHKQEIDRVWPVPNIGGCSGLLAIHIGLMLGYDDILCAGMPMDNTGHYYDPPVERFPSYRSLHIDKAQDLVWRHAIANHFAGRVRSVSGRTKAWLEGVGIAA